MPWVDEREVEREREGQRSRSQPFIGLRGDHDHIRVSKMNDDDDTQLLLPRGTG